MSIRSIFAAASDAIRSKKTQPTDFAGYGVSVVEGVYNAARYYENPEDIDAADLRKMWRRDGTVRNCVELRVLAALSTGYEIEPASDEEADKDAAEFMRDADLALPGGFFGLLRAAQRCALIYGHAMLEPRWSDPIERGDWRGMRWFAEIMDRWSSTIYYHLDPQGRLFKITQDPMAGVVPIEFAPEDVILHRVDAIAGQPYGTSPLRTAYRSYFIKDDAIYHWARYLERYGHPIGLARYPYRQPAGPQDMATSSENKRNKELMITLLRELRQNMGAAVPNGFELDLSHPSHSEHADLYERLIQACDGEIRRSLGIPALVGETSASGGGAYALGKEHNDQFVWVLNGDRQAMERMMDDQVIRPLMKWNFPDTVGMPRFRFRPFAEDDVMQKLAALEFLVKNRGRVAIDHAHETLHVPQAEEDDETLEGSAGGGLAPIVPGEGTYRLPNGQRRADRLQLDEEGEEEDDLPKERKKMAAERRPDTELERRINFAQTNAEEDADAAFAGENLSVIFESMAQALEDQSGKGSGEPLGR